jgi:hypothetical protein
MEYSNVYHVLEVVLLIFLDWTKVHFQVDVLKYIY